MENWIKVQCQTRDENGLRGQQKRKQNNKKNPFGYLGDQEGLACRVFKDCLHFDFVSATTFSTTWVFFQL